MTYVSLSTFTKRDIHLLSDDYQVIAYHFNTDKKWKLPFAFIMQAWFLIRNRNKIDLIVSQSAGYLSFLPTIFYKITKKPLAIIAIGTDCIKMPEINYGAHNKMILAWFTRFSFRNATCIFPVHASLIANDYIYTNISYPQQGIKAFVKNIKTPFVPIVNGFDTEQWKITSLERNPKSFLTVTTALSETGFYLKGIDMIFAFAQKNPFFQFTIVGQVYLKESCPNNVSIIPQILHEKLVEIYNQHTYYLQLSLSEGFPNALCEAMLCGCIPIGSHVAGIPDIIGLDGYVLKNKNIEELQEISSKLDYKSITPQQVRNRIVSNFPISRRKKELIENLNKMLSHGF